MSWQEYEIYITKHLQRLFPESSITHNVRLEGLISKTKRQVDILVEGKVAGFNIRIVIDCKYFNKKVDVKDVESFLSFLQDLKASKGILITNNGYSQAAYNRAEYDSQDIELRIIDFSDLESMQGFIAIPYSGPHCAIVSAPIGWVVDAESENRFLASFYPAGLSKIEAFETEGFIYLSMSHKNTEWPNLKHLLSTQDTESKKHYNAPKIEYIETINKEHCYTAMRIIEAQEMGNTIEYTLFLDYPEVIIFLTLLAPRGQEEKYVKKLEWIGEKLIKGNTIYGTNKLPINMQI